MPNCRRISANRLPSTVISRHPAPRRSLRVAASRRMLPQTSLSLSKKLIGPEVSATATFNNTRRPDSMSSGELLAARAIKPGMRLDRYDLETLCQIKFGVFPAVEADVVDQISLHTGAFVSDLMIHQPAGQRARVLRSPACHCLARRASSPTDLFPSFVPTLPSQGA